MTAGSILFSVALLVLVGLYLARPFLLPHERVEHLPESERLQQGKDALLRQIQALDFDHATGKIPDEVHETERAQLVREAAVLLQQIDQLAASPDNVIEADIEAAVAQLRQQRPVATATNGQGRFCPQCGQPTDPGDKFCAHCGHQLTTRPSLGSVHQ
jgi:NADH pyrophosphatase NudC (nudix superfamily)